MDTSKRHILSTGSAIRAIQRQADDCTVTESSIFSRIPALELQV